MPQSLAIDHRVADFWTWFAAHEPDVFAFESDQRRVLSAIGKALHAVHPALVFALGPVTEERRELVISADGIQEAFPAVVALVEAAPALERWIIVPFRQRHGLGDIQMGGVTIRGASVYVMVEQHDGLIGVTLLVPGYRPTRNAIFEQASFLLLDELLGEFDVESKVGFVDVGPRPKVLPKDAIPLAELPAIVDALPVS